MNRAAPDVDAVVSVVSASKKYRTVCVDTIRRIAERELAHHSSLKPAIKATKRRLHQVYGAFEGEFDYDSAYERLAEAYEAGAKSEIESACRQILGSHSSTRERLPILDAFYTGVFQVTGRPRSILDLGCGLNPVSLPWMALERDARYIAIDIDTERVRFLNRYLALAGLQPLARCQDILVHALEDTVDLAFLLKTSPTLERQIEGATARLLDRIAARFVVVSFAVKSLTGREKGMRDHYQRQFLDLAGRQGWPVHELAFATELVYILEPGP